MLIFNRISMKYCLILKINQQSIAVSFSSKTIQHGTYNTLAWK